METLSMWITGRNPDEVEVHIIRGMKLLCQIAYTQCSRRVQEEYPQHESSKLRSPDDIRNLELTHGQKISLRIATQINRIFDIDRPKGERRTHHYLRVTSLNYCRMGGIASSADLSFFLESSKRECEKRIGDLSASLRDPFAPYESLEAAQGALEFIRSAIDQKLPGLIIQGLLNDWGGPENLTAEERALRKHREKVQNEILFWTDRQGAMDFLLVAKKTSRQDILRRYFLEELKKIETKLRKGAEDEEHFARIAHVLPDGRVAIPEEILASHYWLFHSFLEGISYNQSGHA